jgi:hypothetical protein
MCDVLDVPQSDPTPPDAASNHHVFEKAAEFNNGDASVCLGRIDCNVTTAPSTPDSSVQAQAQTIDALEIAFSASRASWPSNFVPAAS